MNKFWEIRIANSKVYIVYMHKPSEVKSLKIKYEATEEEKKSETMFELWAYTKNK